MVRDELRRPELLPTPGQHRTGLPRQLRLPDHPLDVHVIALEHMRGHTVMDQRAELRRARTCSPVTARVARGSARPTPSPA